MKGKMAHENFSSGPLPTFNNVLKSWTVLIKTKMKICLIKLFPLYTSI